MDRKPVSTPALNDRPTVGVIESISTGFDAVVHRPWLMIVPFALDLLLWLGPRILASPLYNQVAPIMQDLPTTLDANTRLAMQQFMQALQDFFSKFNLFSWLSNGLFGVPTINAGVDATATLATGAAPATVQVGDFGSYLLVLIVFNVIGLLLASVLWVMLVDALRKTPLNFASIGKRTVALWIKLLILAILIVVVLLIAALPVSLMTAIIGSISLGLASFIPLIVFSLIGWGMFALVFTLHGFVLYDLPTARALRLSALVTRLYIGPTLGFVVISLAIYMGLGLILDSFDVSSWARLISMAGNAFLVASLFMASLIYYQSRSSVVLDYLQMAQATTSTH